MTEKERGRRGRPANGALRQTILDAALQLFLELGFQATTLEKVARRARISKLSIYRHFENKEALFSSAIAEHCRQVAPRADVTDIGASAEDQLIAVTTSLLRTLLSPDVRNVEAMIMADKTNQETLSRLFYEAGPAYVTIQIEAVLRQLPAGSTLDIPDPHGSARLLAALIKGCDLLTIARFDAARAGADSEIEAYCRSAVSLFIAAHRDLAHRR